MAKYPDPDEMDTIRTVPVDAPRSISHEDRVRLFGSFRWKAKQPGLPGEIEIDREWSRENIVKVKIPWHGLSTDAASQTRTIWVHKLAAGPIVGLFEDWQHAGLLGLVKTFNGAWVARMKRGHETSTRMADLSNHSWGTAFDINAPWNRLGKRGARWGESGTVEPLVANAYARGFAWGGDFSRPDGQHFELVRLSEA